MTALSASLTALMCSGVSQASDLQIYAMPTAGQKTIVMMVDVSGSMEWGMSGKDSAISASNPARIEALKEGLRAVVNSTDPKLENIVIGLGKYPGDGSSRYSTAQYMRGKILVEARRLGPSTKTNGVFDSAQRRALLSAINGQLAAIGGTPTAHGLTEAASYLMGTRTDSYNLRKTLLVYDESYSKTYTETETCKRSGSYGNSCNAGVSSAKSEAQNKKCSNLSTVISSRNNYYYYGCASGWNNTATTVPADYTYTSEGGWSSYTSWSSNQRTRTRQVTEYYYVGPRDVEVTEAVNASDYSGIGLSVGRTQTNSITHYSSPLPAAEDRVSCDGQGIYVLSDGVPNSSSDQNAETQMLNALANPLVNTVAPSFSCNIDASRLTNPITGGDAGGAWKCMGEFAKRLYSGVNPAGVKIQTAFVGYSNSFNSLNDNDVKNACRLGSRLKGDDCSYYQTDGLTRNRAEYANPVGGYGNGGFYTGNSANDVTTSVLNFIDNLGTDPLAPLPTGTISVPVDVLNPNGLQNVGYLRMLEPNPAQPSLLTWIGNLKKYSLKDGVLVDGSTNIFTSDGEFVTATKNLWGARTQNDGGEIAIGGAYEMMPVPITSSTANFRKVFTDAGSANNTAITPLSNLKANGEYDAPKDLLQIPKLAAGVISSKDTILNQFRDQSVLKSFPLAVRLKLLNYLGFKVNTSLEAFPSNSEVNYEGSPYFSMGGIIHSFPVQMTYSGTINESGELATSDIVLADNKVLRPRNQSVLYGSMEGGLHIVDGATGAEQMVFLPSEILNNEVTSNALVKAGSGTPAPAHGVDSPWVVDAEYRAVGVYPNSQIKATKMNIFGGLRMGGNSYYALDVLDLAAPKIKFRIGSDLSDYARMGQSWSKPVLINIKYKGVPTRAMVVGGGYDVCYEAPRFTLSTSTTVNDTASCTAKTRAKGNAVYVIDAETGKRLFWVSNTGSDADNANLKHSVVSRISTLDRDGDGYTDHLYFGDLGGQIFRVDMDNYQTKKTVTASGVTTVSYSDFGVRTVRLADLATNAAGQAIANGDNPRFYEPVTLTIHDEDSKTFILVGAASGDRSTPLDVAPIQGREGLSPADALTNRPKNKVYGLFDLDFSKTDLITNTSLTGDYTSATTVESVPLKNRLITRNLTLENLLENPQTSITGNETIYSKFFNATAPKHGWYRSLSWTWDKSETGEDVANNTFRQSGGLKAFEEPIAIGNNLFVPVYDPEGTGIRAQNPCLPSVIGETDRQQYCLPFGICVTTSGAIDSSQEKKSGFKLLISGGQYKNSNVIGKGIQGMALANNGGGGDNNCGNFTLSTNTEGLGNWQCTRKLNPTRWFEKR
ncbi:pilus assembly protein PilY [Acinetobacter cumulans]|uniref:Pilus assembly protein PilY n=2 Tax=Acinetobacter cumulans TaxID=2136182 RepID=A0ABX9U8D9_9GAMM|nr:pilus assembly protein PilY [Acinetobacter cumulans]